MLIPVSTHVPWFSPICPRLNFPFLSFETFLTIRQNSLYVTVCMIARTSYQGYFIHSLSTLYYYNAPSLATRLTGDYRDRTCTGKCGPASLDTRHKKPGARQRQRCACSGPNPDYVIYGKRGHYPSMAIYFVSSTSGFFSSAFGIHNLKTPLSYFAWISSCFTSSPT